MNVKLYLELISVSSSCLTHKDPRPFVKLHWIRRAFKLHHLRLRVAALVKSHLLLKDSQREAAPSVDQTWHVKACCLVGSLRVRFGVKELHFLTAGLHFAELDADVHELLGPICDREEDRGSRSGRLDVEEEGEVAVERVGDVGQSRLARHCSRGEDVYSLTPRPICLGDLIRRRVSDQLEQRDATLLCGGGKDTESDSVSKT